VLARVRQLLLAGQLLLLHQLQYLPHREKLITQVHDLNIKIRAILPRLVLDTISLVVPLANFPHRCLARKLSLTAMLDRSGNGLIHGILFKFKYHKSRNLKEHYRMNFINHNV
jgi:hypothetical protein